LYIGGFDEFRNIKTILMPTMIEINFKCGYSIHLYDYELLINGKYDLKNPMLMLLLIFRTSQHVVINETFPIPFD
jgi:hypothetical protein